MKGIFSTALCALYFIIIASATKTTDPICPYPSDGITYFPYPGNCNKYLECFGGIKTEMVCPDGLYWNQKVSYCHYPENVDCDSSNQNLRLRGKDGPPTEEATSNGDGWTPDPLCPYPSNDAIYYPDPESCNKYWECFGGNRTEMTCPEGLFWNEATGSCDFPQNVDCNSNWSTTTHAWTPDPVCPYPASDTTYFPYPGDCRKYYECSNGVKTEMICAGGLYWDQKMGVCDYPENVDCHSSIPTDEPTTNGEWTPDPSCPYPASDTIYFPYPGDCRKYYECANGVKTEMICAGGLYWDQKMGVCDYPENVDCHSSIPTDEPTTNGEWTPDPSCPYPASDTIYFPYPGDCRKYYECANGVKTEMICANGLYWDQKMGVCDYPENVDCHSSIPTDEPTTNGGWTPDPSCPYPSSDTTYFPYPGDCRKYYECANGVKTEMICADGLYWDQKMGVCDYPENVDCHSSIPTDEPTTNGGWTPDPFCPYPSSDTTYFPYPGDCRKYWECFAGIKTEMTCPDDLYWNEATSACDYLENVNCDTTTTSTKGSTSSSDSPTYETTTNGGWTPDPLCPYPSDEIIYFPYPGDCNKYFECYAGVKTVMTCPPDLYWNEELSYCDYPENVDCED